MPVSAPATGAVPVEHDEAKDAARFELIFFLVLAAVIALEGCGLVWLLG
jgi:hypothetical protein